jgi:hypothetical protein
MGHAVAQWLRHCATNRKVARSIPDGVRIFRSHYGPGVDSASNRNKYQECFLGVKAAGAQGWQPCHLHVSIVMKSGSFNLLEPSGPVKACNGIALPILLYVNRRGCPTWQPYHLHVPIVLKSGRLNLEPYGYFQTFNGIGLAFTFWFSSH